MRLHRIEASSKSLALKTCPGSMATYNGTQLPIGATQSFTFKNYLGCDSTVTVTVAALPSSSSSLTLKTCPGTPIVYANTALKAGDVKAFVLKNYLGCDSTVTVTVTALPVSTHSVSLKTCPGTTVTYANTALKAGDVKQFVFKNYVGCDSTVTVSVAASQTSAKTLDVQVCPGETYVYAGATLKAGETRNFTLINAEGCDSIVTVKVAAFPSASFALTSKPSCATLPNGSLTISGAMGGLAPYRYSLDGVKFQDELIFKDLGADAYTVWLEDSNGCLFQQAASIAALARLDVTLLSGVLPCDSTAVRLEPIIAAGDTAGLTYTWHNGAKTPFIIQKEAATVWVELKNQCETVRREASVSWAELPSGFTPVYVPNVVMPESRDPDNYLFRPFFSAGLTLLDYRLEVFDRWGNLMFRTNQIESGWGGEFRKEDMNPGVYVWYLRAHIALCGRVVEINREGDVTVVR